jgi:hypothetical protein
MKKNLILIIAFTLIAIPLQAQEVFEKLSTAQLESVFKKEGYSYTVDKDGDIIWKLEGVRTLATRQSEGACLTLRLSFENDSTTLAKVNDWNRTKRYARSYLDNDGDPVLQADLDLEGGVTYARITDFLRTWRLLTLAWRKEVL